MYVDLNVIDNDLACDSGFDYGISPILEDKNSLKMG